MESTHAEISTAKYKRAFTLSRELDSTKIEASQRDGVLTLHIPKAEHAQPRKIEVQVG
jgi:HSP20 family molecular chaperone IbpA